MRDNVTYRNESIETTAFIQWYVSSPQQTRRALSPKRLRRTLTSGCHSSTIDVNIYHVNNIFKMPPKRKCVSSAHSARQAKKRKRDQREREDLNSLASSESLLSSEETRRQRDAEAHRLVRLDPERRQQEQERNTAARREVRLDPERRQQEQERNTAARRQLCTQNPVRRSEEQVNLFI